MITKILFLISIQMTRLVVFTYLGAGIIGYWNNILLYIQL